MTRGLNVLVLESDPGAATIARNELEGAGHTVRLCHQPGCPTFPCNALRDGSTCPLAGEPVDVALDVRRRPRSQPTTSEDGVACAIREHIPIVVAGPTLFNPFTEYATEMCQDTLDVVAACERAAAAPLARHGAVAQDALVATLERRSMEVDGCVSVHRRAGALVVSVATAEELDSATKSMIAVRIVTALRTIDRHARGIDVVFI
jgi:hypothetical protein